MSGLKFARTLKRIAFAAIPGLFVVFLAVVVLRSSPKSVAGTEAPPFSLKSLDTDGHVIDSADLRGKPLIVNFFASWCVSCRTEASVLERTWQAHKDEGLQFLAISIEDTREDAQAFVSRFGLTFPVARDPNKEVALRFGVAGVPETFFIDHTWTFIGVGTGKKIGNRGQTVIFGPVSPALLKSQAEVLLARWHGTSP